MVFPGWQSGARLPGWYDMSADEIGTWYEGRYQVGRNAGNTSYVALALLQHNGLFENEEYLAAAETVMNWVLKNCRDDTPGFTAGYDGWPEGEPPVAYPFTYKSIEHNIDAQMALTGWGSRLRREA